MNYTMYRKPVKCSICGKQETEAVKLAFLLFTFYLGQRCVSRMFTQFTKGK